MANVNPINLSDADFLRWERVGWLRTLVSAYREVYDAATTNGYDYPAWTDDDPAATAEMLRECEALADELAAALPQTEPAPRVTTVTDDEFPF